MHKYINHWNIFLQTSLRIRRRLAEQRVGGHGVLGRGLAQQPPRLSTFGQAWPVPEARWMAKPPEFAGTITESQHGKI